MVVHACDRYQILYRGFEYFFRRHWPDLDEVGLYFLTEEIDHASDRFTNLKTGKGEWSDRLRTGLQQVAEPTVIYLQEDMWFSHPVNPAVLKDVLDFASAGKLPLLKLHGGNCYQTHATGTVIGGLTVSELDNKKSSYLMSHQPSLWDREFLLAQLTRRENPWRHEKAGTRRLRRLNPRIYQIALLAGNEWDPLKFNSSPPLSGVYKGISVNGILNEKNAAPFIEELMQATDPEMSAYGRRLQYNFVNGLTHDGLPRPKKPRLWKRIKHLLASKA